VNRVSEAVNGKYPLAGLKNENWKRPFLKMPFFRNPFQKNTSINYAKTILIFLND